MIACPCKETFCYSQRNPKIFSFESCILHVFILILRTINVKNRNDHKLVIIEDFCNILYIMVLILCLIKDGTHIRILELQTSNL